VNDAASGWPGRQVLVTGYSGFVGSWLTSALLQLGARVTGFALNEDEHCLARAHRLAERGVVATTGDIREFDEVNSVMASQPFDTVFHLAAKSLVRVGLVQPRVTLMTNIGGSINVLEAARQCHPSVLIHITSDKCYRNRGWAIPYREVDELGGGDPYSVSKAAAELVFEAYAGLAQVSGGASRTASVRFGNVIGGGDHADRLVPNALAAWEAGTPVIIYQPQAVRPWQHVLDVVHGLLLLAEELTAGTVASGECFNFAPPGGGASVAVLVQELADAWERAGEAAPPVVSKPGRRFTEDVLLRLDGWKAATTLNWTHRLDLPAAAELVLAWHRLVRTGRTPADATAAQVHDFLEAVGRVPAEVRAGTTQ
jgi:CDP-glucose 4,6-dehydratase